MQAVVAHTKHAKPSVPDVAVAPPALGRRRWLKAEAPGAKDGGATALAVVSEFPAAHSPLHQPIPPFIRYLFLPKGPVILATPLELRLSIGAGDRVLSVIVSGVTNAADTNRSRDQRIAIEIVIESATIDMTEFNAHVNGAAGRSYT
ncbi:hypothetical protein EVAR_50677_1 [Eumeta japonica]|uniref:Uncharacterized protein n=1 Tax=Eumeta variegata TaxID=151549 RepID=A0A4C1XPM0_EUMVA|nr:hypothetical protein EVAR_50677_1 [Eumeta japonica]